MIDILTVVLNYNTKYLTERCLKSVLSQEWQRTVKVVVVDNHSTDDSFSYLKLKFPKIDFLQARRNLGFAGGNNLALKKYFGQARFCLLLNSDTQITAGSLDRLFNFALEEKWDIVSCRLVYPDGSFQPNGGELPNFWPLFFWLSGLDDLFRKWIRLPSYQERSQSYFSDGREVGWVSGTVMLIRKEVFEKIGFLDEKIFMYGEDVDFCWRAKKAGFKIGWTDKAEVIHLGGGSSDQPHFRQWLGEFKGLLYLYRKHYGKPASLLLKLLIYFFVFLRMVAFFLIGKLNYAKDYAKIIAEI